MPLMGRLHCPMCNRQQNGMGRFWVDEWLDLLSIAMWKAQELRHPFVAVGETLSTF